LQWALNLGIDPHKSAHTAVAIDDEEHELDEVPTHAVGSGARGRRSAFSCDDVDLDAYVFDASGPERAVSLLPDAPPEELLAADVMSN
jgi:hypothetical protein